MFFEDSLGLTDAYEFFFTGEDGEDVYISEEDFIFETELGKLATLLWDAAIFIYLADALMLYNTEDYLPSLELFFDIWGRSSDSLGWILF